MRGGKTILKKRLFFVVKNVLLLKFDGLLMHFYGTWSHFEAFRGG
jgi:hypothetical protein